MEASSMAENLCNESFKALLERFQGCLQQLEKPDSELDELAERLEEGYSLLEHLRNKLAQTETRVDEIIRIRSAQ